MSLSPLRRNPYAQGSPEFRIFSEAPESRRLFDPLLISRNVRELLVISPFFFCPLGLRFLKRFVPTNETLRDFQLLGRDGNWTPFFPSPL